MVTSTARWMKLNSCGAISMNFWPDAASLTTYAHGCVEFSVPTGSKCPTGNEDPPRPTCHSMEPIPAPSLPAADAASQQWTHVVATAHHITMTAGGMTSPILVTVVAVLVEAVAAVLTSSATVAAVEGLRGAVAADAPLLALVATTRLSTQYCTSQQNPPCFEATICKVGASHPLHKLAVKTTSIL